MMKNIRLGQQDVYAQFIDIKLIILMLYLGAFALLWLGYSRFIVPIYGYSGFEWAPNKVKMFESLVALVLFAISLPSKVKRPSDFFIHVHFLLPIMPMLVLYGTSDLPRAYMYFVILAFAIVCFVRKFKLPKIKGDMISIQGMIWSLVIIAAIYIISIMLKGGLRYFNLNLMKVYGSRSLAAESLPGIYGYFSPMISKVLLPFILVLAVYSRKWIVAFLSLAGSFMMFALTHHKGPIFYPFLVLGIYYMMCSQKWKLQLLIGGYIIIILVSLAPFFISNPKKTEQPLSRIIMGSILIRRACFVPAKLNFAYYDFFSRHPHTMLAQSKLTFRLVEYPYELDPSHLIGYHYYNNKLTGANTGWLGSGYMNFGFVSLLIYAIFIGFLLSMVDTLAKRRDLKISVAVLFIPFFTLFLSSDLPTAMLTHGLLLAMLLFWACQIKRRVISMRHKTIDRFLDYSSSYYSC